MTATMVGASSSTSFTQQGKRKTCTVWAQHTKRQRHQSLAAATDSAAIPTAPGPLQMAVTITGVNAAAPRWSTAAALAGAASRVASQVLPLPQPRVIAAGASAPDADQAPGAMVIAPPLAGEKQLAPVPVRFCGYAAMPVGAAASPPLALAAALDLFHRATLGRMLSALTPWCRPPLRPQDGRSGAAPPAWWPTASEPWWGPEVLAHLPGLMMTPAVTAAVPVPFVASKLLKKAQRVAVLVAVVKHLAPDFARIVFAVRQCRLSGPEAALWSSALENEQGWRVRPVFLVQTQQPPSFGVVNDAIAIANGMPWGPAGNNGGQVVAAAQLDQPQEQHAIAPADGYEQVAIGILAGGDSANIGAVVTTITGDREADQEKAPQPEQGGDLDAAVSAAPDLEGNHQLEDVVAPFPATHADDLHHLVRHHCGKAKQLSGAAVEAQEEPGDRPWYENEELRRKFGHMPVGSPHSYDDGYYL